MMLTIINTPPCKRKKGSARAFSPTFDFEAFASQPLLITHTFPYQHNIFPHITTTTPPPQIVSTIIMPKELKASKAVKSTIASKTLTCIYEGKKHKCNIKNNDSEWAIYMAFRNALARIFSKITIHNKNGIPLALKYHEMKTNAKIRVSNNDKIS
jgi:hypothetical protein